MVITIWLGFACYPGIVFNSAFSYSRKYPGLDSGLHDFKGFTNITLILIAGLWGGSYYPHFPYEKNYNLENIEAFLQSLIAYK